MGAPLVVLRPRPEPRTVRRPARIRVVATAAMAALLAMAGAVLIVIALAAQVSAPLPVDAGALAPVAANAPAPVAPTALPPTAATPAVAPPTRVAVPAIGVDAVVTQVGLAPDGTMEVPAPGPDYDLAAWFRDSVSPGARGPSVIIGHVDSREAGPSVFFDLGRVRLSDRVRVTRADGSVVAFEIYAIRTVDKDAFPTADVYGPTADPELRLVTCGGSFDAAAHGYRDNVVVFARAVPGG